MKVRAFIMEDDLRIVICTKRRGGLIKGATGLRDIFSAELEEIGTPNADWFPRGISEVSPVSSCTGKNILGSEEFSSRNSSASDEDGISSSVKNLLKLLVKRASTQSGRDISCVDEDVAALGTDGDKTIGADESWTSSMATPSKNISMFSENNRSPAIDMNLEISKLEVENSSFVGDSFNRRLSCSEEEEQSPKSDFVFYGFEDSVIDERLTSKLNQGPPIYPREPEFRNNRVINPDETLFFLNSLISLINDSTKVELVSVAKTSDDEILGDIFCVVPSVPEKERTTPSDIELLSSNPGARLHTPSVSWCDACDSCVRVLEGDHSSLEICMCLSKKLAMVGKDTDVKSPTESGNADELSLIKSNPICIHEESSSRLPINNKVVSSIDSGCTENVWDESEYVTQMLNPICSPSGDSNSKHGVGNVIISAVKGKQLGYIHLKEESLLIVGKILEELLEKFLTHSGKAESDSTVCKKHNFLVPSDNVEYRLIYPMGKRHVDVTSKSDKVKLEESRYKMFDEELLKEAVANISFDSEEDNWNDSHCDAMNASDIFPSPRLVSSSCKKQNTDNASSVRSSKTLKLDLAVPLYNPPSSCDAAVPSDFAVKVHQLPHPPNPECEMPCDLQPVREEKVDIKVEPENEKELILGSQDFLSCSVLEEVCQASEALAYFGKMKNDCLAGIEMHNGFKSPGKNSNSYEEQEKDGKVEAVKNISGKSLIIDTCANPGHEGPSTSKDSLSHDLGKFNSRCSIERSKYSLGMKKNSSHAAEKVVSEKSVKKKIVFNVAEPSESYDFEDKLGEENDLHHEVLKNSKVSHTVSMPNNVNILSAEVRNSNESNSHVQTNKFVYPKLRSQSNLQMPRVVSPEDLMSRAAQLERYSNLSSSSDKSDLTRLKVGTLMSFSSLEHSHGDFKSELNSIDKDSTHCDGRVYPEKDRSITIAEQCGGRMSVQDKIKGQNKEMRTNGLDFCAKERQEAPEVNIGPDITEGEDLKPLSGVDKGSLSVLATDTEHNIEVIERGEMCTSPILTKKYKTKKPFRRRHRNQFNASTPKTKAKMARGVKEYCEEKTDSKQCNIGLERDLKSGISTDGDIYSNPSHVFRRNNESLPTFLNNKACDKGSAPVHSDELVASGDKGIPTKSSFMEISFTENFDPWEGVDDIDFPEGSPVRNNTIEKITLKKNTVEPKDTYAIRDELLLDVLKKVEVSETPVNHAKEFSEKPCILLVDSDTNSTTNVLTVPSDKLDPSRDSLPLRSVTPGFSTASKKKVAVSESSLDKARQLFSEDMNDQDCSKGLSSASGGIINNPPNAVSKLNKASGKFSTPGTSGLPGFSLASGKKITVSEKSLAQARKLYADEVDDVTVSDDATPLRSDTPGFSTASGKKVAVSESALDKARKLFSEEMDTQDCAKGLSSASGGIMTNPPKTLSKIKNACGGFSTPGTSLLPGFSSASGKKITVSEKSLARARKLFADEVDHVTVSTDSTPLGSDTPGFSTADGNKVSVSESALDKARQLFSEDLNIQDCSKGLSSASGEKINNPPNAFSKLNKASGKFSTPGTSGLPGFSLASGKKITVSEKSLAQARKLYADEVDDVTVSNDATPLRSGTSGFSTASGKKVAVSESSLDKARKLFSEDLNIQDCSKGLSSASGEKINNPPNAFSKLNKASGKFSTPGTSGLPGFSSASGKKISVSEKSLAQARKLFADEVDDVTVSNDATPLRSGTSGFSTASGKEVAVSESSLDKARQLFSEDMNDQDCSKGLSSASSGKINNPPNAFSKVKNASGGFSTPGTSGLPGFSSASGKKISVSEKSLAQARKLFADEVDDVTVSKDSTPSRSDITGFSTASGKKVAVSESSLDKARQLFSEDLNTQDCSKGLSSASSGKIYNPPNAFSKVKNASGGFSTPGTSGLPGFSSASGKKISVSAKSLAQARKLFADEVDDVTVSKDSTPSRSDITGFSTASGKKVAVSESSLDKARQLFSEDLNTQDCSKGLSSASSGKINNPPNAFSKVKNASGGLSTPGTSLLPGFSSASGKKITVSEKSLAQTRKLFADEVDHVTVSNDATPLRSDIPGFSTASGKKVAVSESSLDKARQLFSEDMNDQDFSKGLSSASGGIMNNPPNAVSKLNKASSELNTPGTSGLPGFSSASGKKITVSEKSLAQARKLFAEEVNDVTVSNVCTFLRSDTPGLSSATGKKVAKSEGYLHIPRNLYSDNTDPLGNPKDLGFSAIVSGDVHDSLNSHSNLISIEIHTPGTSGFPGISSTSGDKVVAPENSLHKENNLFSKETNRFGGISNKMDAVCNDGHHLDSTEEDDLFSYIVEPKKMKTECFNPNDNVLSKGTKLNVSSSCQISSPSFSSSVNEQLPKSGHDKGMGMISHPTCSGSVNNSLNFDFQVPLCNSEPSQTKHDARVLKSSLVDTLTGIRKLDISQNNDVLFAESQGDDYIKAVDVKTFDSPATLLDQNPPSPVFRTSRKRRQKLKRFSVKRRSVDGSGTPSSSKFECKNLRSEDLEARSGSLKSSQSSVVTHESSEREKCSDLWDVDIADESWLGKQLDFAEEKTLGLKSGHDIDHWIEGRELQGKVISAKVNVKPVVGHCLKMRRGGHQRRSLRDFVKGKRPGRYSRNQLKQFGVREEIINISSENAAHFKFKLKDYYEESIRSDGVLLDEGFRLIPDEEGMFGVREAQSALLAGPGVDPKLLPHGDWCRNHYRWIVWKLASYEKSFPQDFGGRCLTPENLMSQLKYRWDREIDCGERPAIRKILEKDDTASKRMVLCVSGIKKPTLPESSNKLELDLLANSSLLELTDGWYSISGIVDTELAHFIKRSNLAIGTKIVTSGAELINGPPNGCSPLEPPASLARIRLSANSTRRAKWDAKLGYVCSHPGPLPVSLHSILQSGGAIGLLNDVILARVYPMLSIEKTSDGRRITRSKRAEAKAAARYELKRQSWLESVYAEVSAEMQRELEEEAAARRQKGKRALPGGNLAGGSSKRPRIGHSMHGDSAKSGILSFQGETVAVEELSRLVDESGDPSEVQKMLTSSQVNMISAYRQESRDNFQKELEERVKQKIRQEEEKLASSEKTSDPSSAHSSLGRTKRDVVNLLKVRLVDAKRPIIPKSAVLTIWRPSEDIISLLSKEGSILKIFGVTANGMRSNFIQLSSGKHTRYKLKKSQTLMESSYPTLRREILWRRFDDYEFNSGQGCHSPQPPFGEVDIIAMVIRVEEIPNEGKHSGFQHVYVAGSDGSLLKIAFWGGIQEFAVEEFLYRGSVVVVLNLQWRRLHGLHKIATAQAVETSSFTLNPQEERLKKTLRDFKLEVEAEKELQIIGGDFIQSCEQKLDTVLGRDIEEVSEPCLKEITSKGVKPVLSPVTAPAPQESVGSIRPSVAARMKKLQMYEGSPEITLPKCHIRKSSSVVKAFNPPKKSAEASSSHVRKSLTTVMERCQSPLSYDSERKAVPVSMAEGKSSSFHDSDSPSMSLDSDPLE